MMGHIHPHQLKLTRESRNLSQAQLADASDVSQKQISRLEKQGDGEPWNTCQGQTLRKLAAALGVSEKELAKPPEAEAEEQAKALGLKRVSFYLSEHDRLNYRFLEARYDVKAHQILRAAPLLFLVAAEMSLSARREGLAAVEAALANVPDELTPHLGEIRRGLSRAEDAVLGEEQSVTKRDLAGALFEDDEWAEWHDTSGDLFVDFLKQKARELAPDAFGEEDAIFGNLASLHVELFKTKIEALAAGNHYARLALESGDVHPRDIPSDLIPDESAEERAEWIAERCSKATLSADEKRRDELSKILD